ncbi:hypothetical protein BDB00DRAFT_870476 [Zychaea mexicana]|uniref:uncharacterized protein n=1 Tax=Zychaea mexicana TaxID=64656 RepID=UPI0022FDEC53|nr:uncharacterized protein BDB00DRAFT_870476 [Zychaea mexicana]KAI9495327.1 hypothetical protein BDB00DRAFT_870476 [Zychaea mexicana]
MLATSTMMLESTTTTTTTTTTSSLSSSSSSSRADAAHPRRHSFSSFVRNLMLLISPSVSNDDDDDDDSDSDSDSTTTVSNYHTCGYDAHATGEASKKNSLFLEMYFSFPALEDTDAESNLCAADAHHIHNNNNNNTRSTGASFIVPTSRVLC